MKRKRSKSYNIGLAAFLLMASLYMIMYKKYDGFVGMTGEPAEGASEVTTVESSGGETVYKEYTFRYPDKLTGHYEKHGIDMGFSSEEEYLAAANALINNPDALHKVEAEDGDDVYYLEETDEIAFVSTDGFIRTYFICNGIEYFNKQ